MNKPPEMGYSQHEMYGEQEITFKRHLELPLHWESVGEDSKCDSLSLATLNYFKKIYFHSSKTYVIWYLFMRKFYEKYQIP